MKEYKKAADLYRDYAHTLTTLASIYRTSGQNEAWELVRRIISLENEGGFSVKEAIEIFGDDCPSTILLGNTYSEAAEKVKAWEDSKKIKVGDVVRSKIDPDDGRMVVVEIKENDNPDGYNVRVLYGNLCENWYKKSQIVKTGRTLPVEDWLKQIGADE